MGTASISPAAKIHGELNEGQGCFKVVMGVSLFRIGLNSISCDWGPEFDQLSEFTVSGIKHEIYR